jgi:GAF domain-containing protein
MALSEPTQLHRGRPSNSELSDRLDGARNALDNRRMEFLALFHDANNLAAVAVASARAIQYQGYVNRDPRSIQIGADLEASVTRFLGQHRELPR